MSGLAPSDILREHGVRDTRSCIRDLARHGYGFAPLDASPDLPDLTSGSMVEEPDREGGVLLDVTRSLIPDRFDSSTVDGTGGELAVLIMGGRVNQHERRTTTSVLVNAEAAEQIVSHLVRFCDVYPGWARAFGVGGGR